MTMLKTEAIQKFLHNQPYDFCQKYTPEMEVQVNVAKDDGEQLEGFYAGQRWTGWTDGVTTWKHFRIPWHANTTPHYEDRDIKFDISLHAEAIGMTGWNWAQRKSMWIGFDFDSIINHHEGLQKDELLELHRKIEQIPWVALYTSTSGYGLHLYCFVDIKTQNHKEHAAVGKALLHKLSALTGISFNDKVDVYGGNMWVWHRRAKPDASYDCIKDTNEIADVPINWRDYVEAKGSRGPRKATRAYDSYSEHDIIAAQKCHQLNDEHTKLLKWLESKQVIWWWDEAKNLLVCHTYDLKRAHLELNLHGVFETVATGKDLGQDQNCFCFPLEDGSWIIYRHSKNCKEHTTWSITPTGWSYVYYNKPITFAIAAKLNNGVETERYWCFNELAHAKQALKLLDIDIQIPEGYAQRTAYIKQLRDNRLLISIPSTEHDNLEKYGWAKVKKEWQLTFYYQYNTDNTEAPDHIIRHTVISHQEYKWFVWSNSSWIAQNKSNVMNLLIANNYRKNMIDVILGKSIENYWEIVNIPFKEEYPGNRRWNLGAAQFAYEPVEGPHEHWDLILDHIGKSLTSALQDNKWCLENGIHNGLLYLQAWLAACFQNPFCQLPYLFLYGPQNSGKSILHEALSLLVTHGVVQSDKALTNQQGFNGELKDSIVCTIEEVNLQKASQAADRLKMWVTGKTISIRALYETSYEIPNKTHWIQCANLQSFCPVFHGDTRITVFYVDLPDQEIPKTTLLEHLAKEAPAFLQTLLNFSLPPASGRLAIPVIETKYKESIETINESALDAFIKEKTYEAPGYKILFSEFFGKFIEFLDPIERGEWNKRRVSRELPPFILKARWGGSSDQYLANISFEPPSLELKPFIVAGERLQK